MTRNFRNDRQGSTSVMFSLAMIPLIGTLAVAADYSKAVKHRYALQQAIDSTATALAKDTDALLLTPAQLNARAMQYAQAVAGSTPVDGIKLDVTADKERVHIDASGSVPLSFAKILGQDSLLVKASVTVMRSKTTNIEIALALDNTGSMAGDKIKELRNAVKSLADYMADKSKNPGSTKIAMIPFGTYVKTDPSWMLPSYMESTPPNNWDGCVTDRDQPYDVSDNAPISANTKFWWRKDTHSGAVNCGNLARITPMTSDLALIKTEADKMTASGTTNVPIGIAWGWHALSNSQPLNQGSPEGTKDLLRVLIVLTDGDNTANRWGGNGGNAIDKRMTSVCDNVKASGIVIYTIRVIDGNAGLLKKCATTSTHYFNVTAASQLTPVFEQIASSLSKMRIAQ